jgi:hypothetical protein
MGRKRNIKTDQRGAKIDRIKRKKKYGIRMIRRRKLLVQVMVLTRIPMKTQFLLVKKHRRMTEGI